MLAGRENRQVKENSGELHGWSPKVSPWNMHILFVGQSFLFQINYGTKQLNSPVFPPTNVFRTLLPTGPLPLLTTNHPNRNLKTLAGIKVSGSIQEWYQTPFRRHATLVAREFWHGHIIATRQHEIVYNLCYPCLSRGGINWHICPK